MSADSTTMIPLSQISPNPWNPHRMTEEELLELERSVAESGQWRPILVVEMDAQDESGECHTPYRIVDGEHLYHALNSLAMQGLRPPMARVMVLGPNSQIPVHEQQLIGETINHGMRGSLEDPVKQKQVLDNILKYRKPEVVAKRIGLGVEGVKHLQAGAGLPARRVSATTPSRVPLVSRPGAGAGAGLSGAVQTVNEERKNSVIALVFSSADSLRAFEELINKTAEALGVSREDFKGRQGQYRIEVLESAMERLVANAALAAGEELDQLEVELGDDL